MTTWNKVAEGLWFGDTERPFRGEFDFVLTVSDAPPRTDDGLRHRWMGLPDTVEETDDLLDDAIAWLKARWAAGNSVLVQSPGCAVAELVVAALLVHLGATADEAVLSLQQARPLALTQQRFLDHIRNREVGRA